MRCDCFYRAMPRNGSKVSKWDDRQVRCVTIETLPGVGVLDIVLAAWSQGVSKGNGQTGCFEVQTDEGIWVGPEVSGTRRPLVRLDGSVDPRACFKSWEQLEAEEAA